MKPIFVRVVLFDPVTEETFPVRNLIHLLKTRSTMTGFSVREHMDKFETYRDRMADWLKAGEVVYFEDIVDGIDAVPDAFIGMMKGENLGKRLVRIADDPTL